MEPPISSYRGEEAYLFVSYAHADAAAVYPEIQRLHDAGFHVWYDEGISPGAVWREELGRAIEGCSVFLLFVSSRANTSEHVMKELNFALDNACEVLTVHLEETQLSAGLRLSLSDRQAILKHERSESSYQQALDHALSAAMPDAGGLPRIPAPRSTATVPKRPMVTAAGILLTAAIGWFAYELSPGAPDDESSTAFANRPAIAVLPLDNLSGETAEDYFADGLTEDLIDRLASYRKFPVIGWFSSARYRDGTRDPVEIATELRARYLVRGSARRADDTVRVSVGLFDAETGVQIWSNRYDRALEDILEVQDEISTAIVANMYPQLDDFDQQRALRRRPDDMTAWDLSQKGWWHFIRGTPTDNLAAQDAHAAAMARDPSYAQAAAGLALAHYQSVGFGFSENTEASIAQLVQAAERAVVLDAQDPLSQHALGHAYALTGNREGMIEAFEASLELNPSSSLVAVCAGEGMAMAGESEAAIRNTQLAIRLSPQDPAIFWMYHSLALAHFAAVNYDEAISWAQRALSHNPEFAFALRTLATSLANAGQVEEARKVLARATELEPQFSLSGGKRVLLTGDADFATRYMDGLRAAGLASDS